MSDPKNENPNNNEITAEAFEWPALNAAEAAELRRQINPVELENFEHAFMRRMHQKIADHVQALNCRALIQADKYVNAEKEARSDKEERSNVRCRVRITSSNTLEIAWYRLKSFRLPEGAAVVTGKTYQKNMDGKSATYMVRGEHLKKGRQHKYPLAKFRNDPVWVQRIVEENEAKNEILRKQSEILTEIRRLCCMYDRLTSKFYDGEIHPFFESQRLTPMGSKKGDEKDD